MKGLINLKNKDFECFKWCHVRFINPQNKNSDRINKQDKKIAATLGYRGIDFPMKARDYEIVEERYQNKVFLLYVSKKLNEQVLNVLLTYNEEKSHYVFIKDFNRERCLLINDTQAVKYETGIIKLKNYEKQIPMTLTIYADTECFLKELILMKVNIQNYIKSILLIL